MIWYILICAIPSNIIIIIVIIIIIIIIIYVFSELVRTVSYLVSLSSSPDDSITFWHLLKKIVRWRLSLILFCIFFPLS